MEWDDPDFDAPMYGVSGRLVAVLRLSHLPSRLTLLDALGEELAIPANHADDATWLLLEKLCPLLGDALEAGSRFLEDRPQKIARQAAFDLDFCLAHRVMEEHGWVKDEIRTSIGDLPDAVCDKLAARVEHKVRRTMRLWDKQKLFAPQPRADESGS